MSDFIKIEEAAGLFGVSPWTLKEIIKENPVVFDEDGTGRFAFIYTDKCYEYMDVQDVIQAKRTWDAERKQAISEIFWSDFELVGLGNDFEEVI